MTLWDIYGHSDGRIGRRPYWEALAILLVLSGPLLALPPARWLALFFIWPWVCLISRRMHDFGRAGTWLVLVCLAAFIAAAWRDAARESYILTYLRAPPLLTHPSPWILAAFLIVIGLIKGNAGENRFGPAPLKPEPHVL
ncbi:MAG: hypothetical protein JWP35_2463 [Caulobacter sp.]|nr:hypothetical protein [Caulobacter sp.]